MHAGMPVGMPVGMPMKMLCVGMLVGMPTVDCTLCRLSDTHSNIFVGNCGELWGIAEI